MNKWYLLLVIVVFQNIISAEYNNEILSVFKTFFNQRHVQTVTAHTCWAFDLDQKLLKEFSYTDISVSFYQSIQHTDITSYRYGFLVDLSCDRSTHAFKQISNDRLFNMQTDWILFDRQHLFTNETNSTLVAFQTFETYLGNAYVLPDSSIYLFQEIGNNLWEIWNGFRASKSDTLRVFKIGTASLNQLDINYLNNERSNFRGIKLQTSTVIVEKEKFLGFNKMISSDLDIFAHMHYDIIDTLSKQLNFKYDLNIVNDYGWSLGNGSFGGLTGLLQKEEIDFSATGVFIRADRMTVIDFTVGTITPRNTAMFRQPPLSSVNNILLLPFNFDVWIMIFLFVFIFIITLILVSRLNSNLIMKQKNTLTVQEILLLVHGAVCQQGLHFKPNLLSMRMIIFILFLTSVFVFTSYSANIVVLLQSNSNSINSIRDLVESPITFSVQNNPYGKHYIKETHDSDLKILYKSKMIPNGNRTFIEASEGMEKIRTEFHGFLVEVMSAYKIISKKWHDKEKCGLGEIQLFKLPPLSIALVKKSGHKDIFKQKLIQQMEIGLNKRIINQWIAPKPYCANKDKRYVSVTINEIRLTFKLLGYGVCISLVIFALEILYDIWTNRQREIKPR